MLTLSVGGERIMASADTPNETAQWPGAGSAMGVAVCNILIQGVNVLTGVVTARMLRAEGRGELAAIIIWPQFLAFAMSLGLPSALVYSLRTFPARQGSLLTSALGASVVIGAIAGAIGAMAVPAVLGQYSPETVRLAQLAAAMAPFPLLHVVLLAALQAQGDFRGYNRARLGQPILTVAGLAGLLVLGEFGLMAVAAACLAPSMLTTGWMLVRVIRRIRPDKETIGDALGGLMGYGARCWGTDLMGTLGGQIDRVFVLGCVSRSGAGIYMVALSLSKVLDVFSSAIIAVVYPRSCGENTGEIVKIVSRGARLTLTATLPTALLIGIAAPWALGLVYGEEFVAAATVTRLLLVRAVVGALASVLAQGFLAAGRPGFVTAMQGLGVGSSILLLTLLVPSHGLIGAGWALLLSEGLRLAGITAGFPLALAHRIPRVLPRWSESVQQLEAARQYAVSLLPLALRPGAVRDAD